MAEELYLFLLIFWMKWDAILLGPLVRTAGSNSQPFCQTAEIPPVTHDPLRHRAVKLSLWEVLIMLLKLPQPSPLILDLSVLLFPNEAVSYVRSTACVLDQTLGLETGGSAFYGE